MGGWFSTPPPQTPIKGICPRLKNIANQNFRGILGTIGVMIIMPAVMRPRDPQSTTLAVWLSMFWMLLIQPVNIPVLGLVPIFALPCLGVLSSVVTCSCYFNSGMVLFVIGGYLVLLLNISNFDKRVILKILNTRNITPMGLVLKAMFAAFILSMFSNCLFVTQRTMELVARPLIAVQTMNRGVKGINHARLRYIAASAIASSATMGSISVVHTSFSVMAFRVMYEHKLKEESMDIFNFFDYSLFAMPVAITLFCCNVIVHAILVKIMIKGDLSTESVAKIKELLNKAKTTIPKKLCLHEAYSIFFTIIVLGTYYSRWNNTVPDFSWCFRKTKKKGPAILDAVVSAGYSLLLHILPKGFSFLKLWSVKKQSQMPKVQPESGILFWRFVDKATPYSYIFLIGSGTVLSLAFKESHIQLLIKPLRDLSTNTPLFTLALVAGSVLLANIMTSMGACIILLPIVLNLNTYKPELSDYLQPLAKITHIMPLAVGMGCAFGFALPFRRTPAYYVKTTARVPTKEQIKHSIPIILISILVLWLFIQFYSPVIFHKGSVDTAALSDAATPTTTEETTESTKAAARLL